MKLKHGFAISTNLKSFTQPLSLITKLSVHLSKSTYILSSATILPVCVDSRDCRYPKEN